MTLPIPREDLQNVVAVTHSFWQEYRGAKLLITGGTGFIGRWLVEAVQHANDSMASGIGIVVVTRDGDSALRRLPHIFERDDVSMLRADVRNLFQPVEGLALCIHGAAAFSDPRDAAAPRLVFDTIVQGTQRVVELASRSPGCRLLLLSSGAVYGDQPDGLRGIPETYNGAPSSLSTKLAYGNAKRTAEWLVASSADAGLRPLIARVFSILGPGIDLNRHFAAANFIRDVLAGVPLDVKDGRAIRSYLYAADLCIWLLKILGKGAVGSAYNVGSERPISISQLASLIGSVGGGTVQDTAARPVAGPASRYVPDVSLARAELGLVEYTALEAGVRQTIDWCRKVAA